MVSEVNLSFFTPCLLNNASPRLFILGDEAISALIEALESEESVLARGDVDIVENAGLKLVVEGETVCDLGECDIATRLLTWAIAHTYCVWENIHLLKLKMCSYLALEFFGLDV